MKTIAVIVRTADPARATEALRAAVGLTLRGDRVRVALGDAVTGDISRAVATLALLHHEVLHGDAEIPRALDGADAVEVWS